MTWVILGGGGGRRGDVSQRGLRRRQWQEGALKSKPGQIQKGLHPAHGTQRRAPGGSGFRTGSAGQSAPLLPVARASSVLASIKKQEVAGRRSPEPRKVSQCSATRKDRAG